MESTVGSPSVRVDGLKILNSSVPLARGGAVVSGERVAPERFYPAISMQKREFAKIFSDSSHSQNVRHMCLDESPDTLLHSRIAFSTCSVPFRRVRWSDWDFLVQTTIRESPQVRRPFVAGNWKMNLTKDESVELASAVASAVGSGEKCEVAVCPPSTYLQAVVDATKGSAVGVGAQNVYHEASGAFTGEISTGMVKDVGAGYIILGHSERRNILGESNEDVNKKLHAVLAEGLTPIVCVGELLEEREAGRTLDVIKEQFTGSFANVTAKQMAKCVVAYEPVWAIGTGKVASPEQAEEVHANLRSLMTEAYDAATADVVRIQYGGSVKPDNAAELLGQPNIDGALVGGAALKADSFAAIVDAAG